MCSFSPQITLISLIFRQIFADYTDGFPSESVKFSKDFIRKSIEKSVKSVQSVVKNYFRKLS